MKYALIELPDDFEKGCCQDCPLSYTECFDDDGYADCQDFCVLNSRYDECPLDIRTEKIPFDFDLFEAGLMCLPNDIVKVLDKIRAEIGRFAYAHCIDDDIKVYDVFKIIDKYRESEEI